MSLKYILQRYLAVLLVVGLISACQKQAETFENPYSGGKAPLGVVFSNVTVMSPTKGAYNTVVTLNITGLMPYKDKFQFAFNGEVAEIIETTATTLTVKVPISGSTGATSIIIGDQVFFGPEFTVLGKVNSDPFFKAPNGTNGFVYNYLKLKDNRLFLVGGFDNYNLQGSILPNAHIVSTSKEGELDRSFLFGSGANGNLNGVVATANDANFFIAGSFGRFNKTTRYINNITRLFPNGNIDTTLQSFYSTINGGAAQRGRPSFNGGTDSEIKKVFYDNNKIIAVGSFNYYLSRRYTVGRTKITTNPITLVTTTSYIDSVVTDSLVSKQVARFNLDGSLDKTYHFNIALNKSLDGGNGYISDSYLQTDGKLVLVGAFTKFDNITAGHIVRLNTDGTVDETFTSLGANGNINGITYNAVTDRYLVSGTFGSYNGQPAQGIVMLKTDGTVDNSFVAKDMDNGFPSFAHQISNGLIVISGSFKKYNGVRRVGFAILNPDGSLAPGYNSTGDFSGSLFRILESRNQDNKISLMLMGNFSKFDNQVVNNITAITIDDL